MFLLFVIFKDTINALGQQKIMKKLKISTTQENTVYKQHL
ncbi:MAG: hypothetical protein ACJA1Z_002370 [Patiriisocius sp.]|jgi:hypothetical protein